MKHLWKILVVMAVMLSLVVIPATVSADPSPLTLDNKTAGWALTPSDGIGGTLTYNSSGATFDFSFSATGLTSATSYDLIYYADPSPGNFPGAFIATFITDGSGAIPATTGSVDLGINLPTSPDGNIIKDYCGEPDHYVTCHGAKIWLVLSSNYDRTTRTITSWNFTKWLFETDLINYTRTSSIGLTIEVTDPEVVIGITVVPANLNFGEVARGSASAAQNITLTNIGDVAIDATATTSAGFYADCLQLSNDLGITWIAASGWTYSSIAVSGNKVIKARVLIPSGYTIGTYAGSISFLASATP